MHPQKRYAFYTPAKWIELNRSVAMGSMAPIVKAWSETPSRQRHGVDGSFDGEIGGDGLGGGRCRGVGGGMASMSPGRPGDTVVDGR